MTRLVMCRSCGHTWPRPEPVLSAYRVWCEDCWARYVILTHPGATPPESEPDALDAEPDACLACGGRLQRSGDPPCDRCGGPGADRS